MNTAIIGQEKVVELLLIAFLADGHVLMDGLPGVAKTRSIKTLGKLVESEFRRVQVTVAGTTHKGPPLFIVLATQNPNSTGSQTAA